MFGCLTGQTQLMLAKKPPKPLMIDRLAGPLLKFWKNPAVAVVGTPWGMLLDDLANVVHQFLLLFGGLLWAILPVVVGASEVGLAGNRVGQSSGLEAPIKAFEDRGAGEGQRAPGLF